jgi:predicted Zn-dependent protease
MKKITVLATIIFMFYLCCGCNGLIGQNPQDCYEKGRKNFTAGNRGLAYKYLAKAANAEPENVKYQWAAACAAPNPKFALYHIKNAWDNGLRNREVFDIYRKLSVIFDSTLNQNFVFQLYRQLPDSIRTSGLRADIFYSFRNYDSTLVILQDLFKREPSQRLANGIAKTYLAMGDNEKAKAFLLESRESKLLNSDGYSLLNLAYLHSFDFAGSAVVFEAAKKDGLYDDELKSIQARGFVAQGKYDEAEPLLQQLMVSETGKNPDFKRNIRSTQAFIYFIKGDKKALLTMDEGLQGDSGSVRLEKLYLDAIIRRLSDTTSLVPVLTNLLKKYPAYPEIQILLALELARTGNNSAALKVYQNLPEIYLLSPRIIVDRARLFDLTGKSSDALAMLSVLHSRKIASKASLELFRDISFKKNSIDDAMKAQTILEKVYKNDVGVRWAKGTMLLNNGNYDSAITVFSALVTDFPRENRFFLRTTQRLFQ